MKAATKLAAALGGRVRVWKIGPGGIVIDINSTDPDTPALVWDSVRRRYSSTYQCATEQGGIEDAPENLSTTQLDWLATFSDQVDRAFEIARRGMKQYQ